MLSVGKLPVLTGFFKNLPINKVLLVQELCCGERKLVTSHNRSRKVKGKAVMQEKKSVEYISSEI